jgi:hypothetical protein
MISVNEESIVGSWLLVNGKIEGDEVCNRVDMLTDGYLVELGTDWTGWETLFRDPGDGRYWERTFPQSGMHGGGPRALFNLSEVEARVKYPHLFDHK